MEKNMRPLSVKGINIYPFTSMEKLTNACYSEKKLFLSVNAEILMRSDNAIKTIFNEHIGYADGIGAVKALKQKGIKNAIRLPGCELWQELVKKYGDQSTFYLCGSTSEVIEKVIQKLKKEYPLLSIAGYRNGFFKNEEEINQLEEELIEKKPDFVFIATGFPFQEKLMARLWKKHAATYLSLGGSFDVYTNTVKRAPIFFQRLGLEWLYRLMKQPSRIKRQYVLFKFVWQYYTHQL